MRSFPCLVLTTLALSCQFDPESTDQTCLTPRLPLLQGRTTSEGMVLPSPAADAGGLVPMVAYRDASVTIVGFCLGAMGLPAATRLVAESSSVSATGGVLFQGGQQTRFNYVLYPMTRERSYEIIAGPNVLGRVLFPPLSPTPCPLRARPPFHVVRCGALVVVDWSTEIPLRPTRVGPIDASVREFGTPNRRDLGFYFEGIRSGEVGLVVRFGFVRPEADRVGVQLNTVYERRGDRDFDYPLNPALRRPLVLALRNDS